MSPFFFFLGGGGGPGFFCTLRVCLDFVFYLFSMKLITYQKKCVDSGLLVKVENLDLLGEVTSV